MLRTAAAQLGVFRRFHTSSPLKAVVPIVYERDELNIERAMDVYSRLLKDRVVMLVGAIDEQVSQNIVAQLLFLESQDARKPVSFRITSQLRVQGVEQLHWCWRLQLARASAYRQGSPTPAVGHAV